MSNSNRKSKSRKAAELKHPKPDKPYTDFPLQPSSNGYWIKRINGKIHTFGRWGKIVNGKLERLPDDGWQEALTIFNAQKDDLYAGRTPRVLKSGGLTVAELCNHFRTAKKHLLDTGEIAIRTYSDYIDTTDRLVQHFGGDRLVDDLDANDFQSLRNVIAQTHGPVALGNAIQRSRGVFKFGYDNGLIANAVRYGQGFNKPSKKVIRKARASNGSRMFEADEIRLLIDAASPPLKAMILLGVNAGFGNTDCGTLPNSVLDLDEGWVSYARPKTGVARRCPLWPETVEALKAAIAERPEPKKEEDADLVFITIFGKCWARGMANSPVTQETTKLMRRVGLHKPGRGFYGLRHSFRTIADAAKDLPAIRMIMGHSDGSIDDQYRERIDDDRLIAVTDHVHAWLFGTDDGGEEQPEPIAVSENKEIVTDENEQPTLRLFAG